jgi:hypothetical protein
MKKKIGRQANHPRGTVSPPLQAQPHPLPHMGMVGACSEAAASAPNHRPGPSPRRPPTLSAKPRCPTAETPKKHQGLQGGVFKKIAMRAPPPPTPSKFGFSPEETLGFVVWEGRVPRQCLHEGVTTPEGAIIVGTNPRLVRGFRPKHRHPTGHLGETCHMGHIVVHRRPRR